MANPWSPALWNEKPAEAAVSTPIDPPGASTRAPPESPGWMLASIWISPVSCSLVPSLSSVGGDRLVEGGDRAAGAAGRAADPAGVAQADDLVADRHLEESPMLAVVSRWRPAAG